MRAFILRQVEIEFHVQRRQPFLTLFGAYALLNEQITAMNVAFALCVVTVVVLGKHTRAK